MPFARALLETAEAHPDQLAIADAERTLDAAGLVDLAGRVSTLVETLTAEQARDGRAVAPPPEADGVPVIALVIDDAFDLARILAAVMCARAVVTVVDTVWPFAHRIDTVRRAQATLVVTDQPELRDALGEQGGPQTLSVAEFDARAGDSALASIQVRPDDEPFLLLFTSGTTNLPKGFIKNRANWRACIPVSLEHFGAAEGLITQAPGSLAYSLTLYALVEALGTGGGCLVARNFEPFAAAAQLEAGRADRFVGVPAAVHALAVLARRRPEALESLRWAITGGANLSGRMRDEFAAAVPPRSASSAGATPATARAFACSTASRARCARQRGSDSRTASSAPCS
jgi:acyl-coenzyme A synthetase/AMP-(fatty) acid ligase